jgi:3-dehydroquinate synthase
LTQHIFNIQKNEFNINIDYNKEKVFNVTSSPRPYKVEFVSSQQPFKWLETELSKNTHPLILIDSYVKKEILSDIDISKYPTMEIVATEGNKDIKCVLEVCDFLKKHGANRGSMLYVIGGGILQDLGAFAGYMFKRGIPWTFIPTTLLAQGDSCLGGKTAVNYNGTKNMLGLFSAPRSVLIDSNFIKSLGSEDYLSGGGEIFRLMTTGGPDTFKSFADQLDDFLARSTDTVNRLVYSSLCVKKAIVEFDEFEIDVRRSMNYGHSIGHAIEALTDYKIPHGTGVAIGILVENKIAYNRGMIGIDEENTIYHTGSRIISPEVWKTFAGIKTAKLLPLLSSDKKVEGSNLKLATLQSLGDMRFVDLPLDKLGMKEVETAIKQVLELR